MNLTVTHILSSILVHRSEQRPSSETESYFFGSGGSLRKRGGGGGGGGGRGSSGGRGGDGRLLHGRLARQELLEDGVHLTADHLLKERGERGGAMERERDRVRHGGRCGLSDLRAVNLDDTFQPMKGLSFSAAERALSKLD